MPNGDAGTFHRAQYVDLTKDQLQADWGGNIHKETINRLYEQMQREVLYKSEHYQVAIDKETQHGFPGCVVWHLSVKRNDKEVIFDWRDMQDIKNKLVGPEYEAIQLFPAESRLVDTANQFHFYAFVRGPESGSRKDRKPPRIPIGWTSRMVMNDQFINGRQRKRNG